MPRRSHELSKVVPWYIMGLLTMLPDDTPRAKLTAVGLCRTANRFVNPSTYLVRNPDDPPDGARAMGVYKVFPSPWGLQVASHRVGW